MFEGAPKPKKHSPVERLKQSLIAGAALVLPMESPALAEIESGMNWQAGHAELERMAETEPSERLTYFISVDDEGSFYDVREVRGVSEEQGKIRIPIRRVADRIDREIEDADNIDTAQEVRVVQLHTHPINALRGWGDDELGQKIAALADSGKELTNPPSGDDLFDANPEFENVGSRLREISDTPVRVEYAAVDPTLTYYYNYDPSLNNLEEASTASRALNDLLSSLSETESNVPQLKFFEQSPLTVFNSQEFANNRERIYELVDTHDAELGEQLRRAEEYVKAPAPKDLDELRTDWMLFVADARAEQRSWDEILSGPEYEELRNGYAQRGFSLSAVPNERVRQGD